jgi:hypothetical protein
LNVHLVLQAVFREDTRAYVPEEIWWWAETVHANFEECQLGGAQRGARCPIRTSNRSRCSRHSGNLHTRSHIVAESWSLGILGIKEERRRMKEKDER